MRKVVFVCIGLALVVGVVMIATKQQAVKRVSPLKVELRMDRWTQVNGPYGGLITDAEKADDKLWIATSYTHGDMGSNGAYQALDGGRVWLGLGGTRETMRDIAVDQSDPSQAVFVDASGLVITNDTGATWERPELGEGLEFQAVAMSPVDPVLVFVGVRSDDKSLLFVSNDDGNTWVEAAPLPDAPWSVRPLWAGFVEESRHDIQVIEPHPTNDQVVFVGTSSALFKTADQGKSWQRADVGFHRSDILDIDFNPKNMDEVYVRVGVFEDMNCLEISNIEDREEREEREKEKCAGVYKSEDSGETWEQLDAHYSDPSEGGIFVDVYDPNNVYAIFSRMIFKTKDAGQSWRKFFWTHDEPFIPNVGIERLLFGEDSDELYLAGRGGLFGSDDGGKHWEERNRGFIGSEVVDIVRASDGTLYAGTLSLGMFKSSDGGQSWTFASYNLENPYVMLVAVHPDDPQTVFVTTNGGVYVSRDGAETWKPVAEEFFFGGEGLLPGVAHFHGIAIDPSDPNRMYVGGGGDQWSPEGAGMSVSEDGGKTWRHANIGFETDVHVGKIVIDTKRAGIVYATTQGPTDFATKTGSGHGVFKSTDNGETWTTINVGLETVETNTIVIDSKDSDVLYLGTDDDGIYKSTDGGTSWNQLNILELPASYGVGDIVIDPRDSDVLYAATVDYFRLSGSRGLVGDHGVFLSRDGGKTWQSFNEGLEHAGAFSLELDADLEILYVGTRGGGVYWRSVKD